MRLDGTDIGRTVVMGLFTVMVHTYVIVNGLDILLTRLANTVGKMSGSITRCGVAVVGCGM